MKSIEENLAALELQLPAAPGAGGNYVPFKIIEKTLILSGVISVSNGRILTGQVGQSCEIEEAREAAKACALNALAVIKEALGGSFDRLDSIHSMSGYVNGISDFPDAPLVINGASDLFIALMGDSGRHTRTAVTVAGLPKGAMVEIQVTAGLK
ncbi:MAG: RidA family protein [Verrucomicrobiota bacterium]